MGKRITDVLYEFNKLSAKMEKDLIEILMKYGKENAEGGYEIGISEEDCEAFEEEGKNIRITVEIDDDGNTGIIDIRKVVLRKLCMDYEGYALEVHGVMGMSNFTIDLYNPEIIYWTLQFVLNVIGNVEV